MGTNELYKNQGGISCPLKANPFCMRVISSTWTQSETKKSMCLKSKPDPFLTRFESKRIHARETGSFVPQPFDGAMERRCPDIGGNKIWGYVMTFIHKVSKRTQRDNPKIYAIYIAYHQALMYIQIAL